MFLPIQHNFHGHRLRYYFLIDLLYDVSFSHQQIDLQRKYSMRLIQLLNLKLFLPFHKLVERSVTDLLHTLCVIATDVITVNVSVKYDIIYLSLSVLYNTKKIHFRISVSGEDQVAINAVINLIDTVTKSTSGMSKIDLSRY